MKSTGRVPGPLNSPTTVGCLRRLWRSFALGVCVCGLFWLSKGMRTSDPKALTVAATYLVIFGLVIALACLGVFLQGILGIGRC